MRWRDLIERVFWTAVAAAGAALPATIVFDLKVWESAAAVALTAAINAVTVIARNRLSSLPDPGEGLPGLPTNVRVVDDGVSR